MLVILCHATVSEMDYQLILRRLCSVFTAWSLQFGCFLACFLARISRLHGVIALAHDIVGLMGFHLNIWHARIAWGRRSVGGFRILLPAEPY